MEASFAKERSGRPEAPRRWRRRRRGLLVFVAALTLVPAAGVPAHEAGGADDGTPGGTPVVVASVLKGVAGHSGVGPGASEAPGVAASEAPSETPPGTGRAVFRSAVLVLGVIIAAAVIFVRLRRLRGRL